MYGKRTEAVVSAVIATFTFTFALFDLPQNTNNDKTMQDSYTKANESGEEAQKETWGL